MVSPSSGLAIELGWAIRTPTFYIFDIWWDLLLQYSVGQGADDVWDDFPVSYVSGYFLVSCDVPRITVTAWVI